MKRKRPPLLSFRKWGGLDQWCCWGGLVAVIDDTIDDLMKQRHLRFLEIHWLVGPVRDQLVDVDREACLFGVALVVEAEPSGAVCDVDDNRLITSVADAMVETSYRHVQCAVSLWVFCEAEIYIVALHLELALLAELTQLAETYPELLFGRHLKVDNTLCHCCTPSCVPKVSRNSRGHLFEMSSLSSTLVLYYSTYVYKSQCMTATSQSIDYHPCLV